MRRWQSLHEPGEASLLLPFEPPDELLSSFCTAASHQRLSFTCGLACLRRFGLRSTQRPIGDAEKSRS